MKYWLLLLGKIVGCGVIVFFLWRYIRGVIAPLLLAGTPISIVYLILALILGGILFGAPLAVFVRLIQNQTK